VRRLLLLVAALALLGAACAEEESTPIDLGRGGASPSERPAVPHAINETPEARAFAEQQCRDDPGLDEGVIRIVDPVSEQVVGEIVVECEAVRADAEPGR
jgi:hypothetical protein